MSATCIFIILSYFYFSNRFTLRKKLLMKVWERELIIVFLINWSHGWRYNTWGQQNSGGGSAVECLSDGDDVGVVDHTTVEIFYVTESFVSVAGQRVAIAPSETGLVAHCTNAGLPWHGSYVVLTVSVGLHIVGRARLCGQKKRQNRLNDLERMLILSFMYAV